MRDYDSPYYNNMLLGITEDNCLAVINMQALTYDVLDIFRFCVHSVAISKGRILVLHFDNPLTSSAGKSGMSAFDNMFRNDFETSCVDLLQLFATAGCQASKKTNFPVFPFRLYKSFATLQSAVRTNPHKCIAALQVSARDLLIH